MEQDAKERADEEYLMDKEQIIKKIKKINKWGLITFYILLSIFIVSSFAIKNILPMKVSLFIIFILGLIDMFLFSIFIGYVEGFIKERYKDLYQKKSLKDKILKIIQLLPYLLYFLILCC
jgi:hypothetical protein